MSNPLTGAHDTVVQVSVGTLNRLLATMHQNDGTGTSLPTIPHSAFVRVGDDPAQRVDGVHGVARVQSGVPRLELLHLSHDRDHRQRPDPGVVHRGVGVRAVPRARPRHPPGRVRPAGDPGCVALPHSTRRHPPAGASSFDVDPDTVTFTSVADTSHDAAITRGRSCRSCRRRSRCRAVTPWSTR